VDDPKKQMPKPYDEAPRLPEGEHIDVRQIVRGTHYELEVGSGRGGFVYERAAAVPERAIIGLEIKRKWSTIVDLKLHKTGVAERARVFAEDAKLALPRLGPDGVLERAYLHFPDPWWKKRHEKRLVMGDLFLREMARLIRPGGELFIQTDVQDRANEYANQVATCAEFLPHGDVAGAPQIADHEFVARSPREHRAIADGLPVYRLLYRRR
jgi:tRNA (guanine-N7-)-methyltransferase